MEEQYEVIIRGISPLLQHRFTGEQGTRRTGQNYDNEEMARESRYCDSEGNLVQPALHLEASMIKAAANFRFQGKKTYRELFKSAVFVEPDDILHRIQDWVMDERPVVVSKARIIRARARLDEWELAFTISVIDERITAAVVREILSESGKYHGIGDYRPRFGRFEVVYFERIEETNQDQA